MLQSLLFDQHLDEDEEVRLIVHKHWLLGGKYLALPTVAFACAWLIPFLGNNRPIWTATFVAAGAAGIWWLRSFFDYYLDAWVITDRGVIDLEWHGWFHRESSRVLYSDVQGVSYEIHGIAGTLLRYGSISIEKISTGSVISIDNVPHPRRVETLIMRNMEEYMHTKNLKDAKTVQTILAEFVASSVQSTELSSDEE